MTDQENAPLSEQDSLLYSTLSPQFPAVSETVLKRFIRGYAKEKNREEKTREMLTQSLAWRVKILADGLATKALEKQTIYDEIWPHDFIGWDKHGHPIYVEHTGGIETERVKKETSMEEIKSFHVQMMETLERMKRDKSKESGKVVYKHMVIMDLSGMTMKHMSNEFRETMKSLIHVDQYYYPETLYKLYIINAPIVFRMLWTVVKPWLHPMTVERIKIVGSDYVKELGKEVDLNVLPEYFGGKGCRGKSVKDGIEVRRKEREERVGRWRQEDTAQIAKSA